MGTCWKIVAHKRVATVRVKLDRELALFPLQFPLSASASAEEQLLDLIQVLEKLCGAPVGVIGIILWDLMSCHAPAGCAQLPQLTAAAGAAAPTGCPSCWPLDRCPDSSGRPRLIHDNEDGLID